MSTLYRLREGYLLRGWDQLPYVVLRARSGRPEFVSRGMMDVLGRCDGSWDFDAPSTSDTDRERVRWLIGKGFVEQCPAGSEIAPEQRYRLYQNRFVQTIHWSITGGCNYRCRHCFMSAPDERYGSLSHEAVLEVARQIGECGVPRVSLTGGEPLVREDFLDIVAELTRHGIVVGQLYTNGALLSDRVLEGLAALGQRPTVIMSFDGVGRHDWLRGISGAERAADSAFARCASHGFRTHAQVSLHRGNIGELRETILHLAELGCSSARAGCVRDEGAWKEHGGGLTLTSEEWFQAALDYIPAYYEDGMPLALTLSGVFSASPDRPHHYGIPPCHPSADHPGELVFACARHTLQLYPDARPAICDRLDPDFVGMSPIVSDDPRCRTQSLREVLSTGSRYMKLMDIKSRELYGAQLACARCAYLGVCGGGCRATAYESSGSILGRDAIACTFFREGWARRVVDTMHSVRPEATSGLQIPRHAHP